jgi:hypothetical protein
MFIVPIHNLIIKIIIFFKAINIILVFNKNKISFDDFDKTPPKKNIELILFFS